MESKEEDASIQEDIRPNCRVYWKARVLSNNSSSSSNSNSAVTRVLECDDLLDYILQFVCAWSKCTLLSLVDRRWRDACNRPSAWAAARSLESLTIKHLPYLLPRLTRISVLSWIYCEPDPSTKDPLIAAARDMSFHRLTDLEIPKDTAIVRDVARRFTAVTKLTIHQGRTASIGAILPHVGNLTSLHIHRPPWPLDPKNDLDNLHVLCPLLTTYGGVITGRILVSLTSCRCLTDVYDMSFPAADTFDPAVIRFFEEVGPRLVRLNTTAWYGLDAAPLIGLHCATGNLRELAFEIRSSIKPPEQITKTHAMLRKCGASLTSLHMYTLQSYVNGEADLHYVSAECPSLESLEWCIAWKNEPHCIDVCLKALSRLSHLVHLQLFDCLVSNEMLLALVEQSVAMRTLKVTHGDYTRRGIVEAIERRAALDLPFLVVTDYRS